MIPSESHFQQLLAENGYEVAKLGGDVVRVHGVEKGFRAAPEGNALA